LDIVFRQLVLRPSCGAHGQVLGLGDALQVEIGVEGLAEVPGGVMIVTFGASSNPCIVRISSLMKQLDAACARQTQETIVLTLPAVPFTPGDYHIDLMLKASDQRGIVDVVHRAAEFKVVPTNLLETGYSYTLHDGVVVVPFDWEIRPRSP